MNYINVNTIVNTNIFTVVITVVLWGVWAGVNQCPNRKEQLGFDF
jgi:hypothetical protein